MKTKYVFVVLVKSTDIGMSYTIEINKKAHHPIVEGGGLFSCVCFEYRVGYIINPCRLIL